MTYVLLKNIAKISNDDSKKELIIFISYLKKRYINKFIHNPE